MQNTLYEGGREGQEQKQDSEAVEDITDVDNPCIGLCKVQIQTICELAFANCN